MVLYKQIMNKIILISCMLPLIALGACQSAEEPPLEQLLIGEDDLPGEWVVSEEGPHVPGGSAPLGGGFGAIDALVIFFYHPAGDGSAGAHEQLYHFQNYKEAEEAYEKLLGTAFSERSDWYWSVPEFDIPSLAGSSESIIRCTKDRPDEMCRLVARYGMYLLDLKVDLYGLNSQLKPVIVLTYNEFLEIIDAVDAKMSLV